jgi:hypothetical protein
VNKGSKSLATVPYFFKPAAERWKNYKDLTGYAKKNEIKKSFSLQNLFSPLCRHLNGLLLHA